MDLSCSSPRLNWFNEARRVVWLPFLAFQFFLRRLNRIDSSLVFVYFTNAVDMDGPSTEHEWHGAIRLIHSALGVPADLSRFRVYDAFVDARLLTDRT